MNFEHEVGLAIEKFTKENGTIQETITVPHKLYHEMLEYAKGTELGRSFLRYGFKIWNMPVFCGDTEEIIINAYFNPKIDRSFEEITNPPEN
jgi:hypothetical protein